jgi:hypothetical protein
MLWPGSVLSTSDIPVQLWPIAPAEVLVGCRCFSRQLTLLVSEANEFPGSTEADIRRRAERVLQRGVTGSNPVDTHQHQRSIWISRPGRLSNYGSGCGHAGKMQSMPALTTTSDPQASTATSPSGTDLIGPTVACDLRQRFASTACNYVQTGGQPGIGESNLDEHVGRD